MATLACGLALATLLGGCSSPRRAGPGSSPAAGTPAGGGPVVGGGAGTGTAAVGSGADAARGSTAGQPGAAPLPPVTRRARDWDDYRLQAALRIVAANPELTYDGEVQQPALAIPVLEIELHADGSVRRVVVLRQPGQARDTVQLAIDAVQRAAPFGPAGHLPRPLKFTEVFLFNDARRFKPRTLDVD